MSPCRLHTHTHKHRRHTWEPFYLIISTLVAHSHPISFSLCVLLLLLLVELSLLSLDARRDSRNTLINLNSVSTCQLNIYNIFRSVGKKLKCSVLAWVRQCRCWSRCCGCWHILHTPYRQTTLRMVNVLRMKSNKFHLNNYLLIMIEVVRRKKFLRWCFSSIIFTNWLLNAHSIIQERSGSWGNCLWRRVVRRTSIFDCVVIIIIKRWV